MRTAPDVLAGLPVSPPVWKAEFMSFDVPVDLANAVPAGSVHYFPSRADRGMWPVIGLMNGVVIGITAIQQSYIYITLCDVHGDKLLSEFPMGMIAPDPFAAPLPGPGVPARALQFDRLPVSWENSYWQIAAPVGLVFASPQTFAIWAYYGKPSRQ